LADRYNDEDQGLMISLYHTKKCKPFTILKGQIIEKIIVQGLL